jgi:acetyltransferase-like isoleucine patch superfamily enzyme
MRTGLGLYKKFAGLIAFINLFRFWTRKCFLGFEYANVFLKRVDKKSVQLILKRNGAQIGSNCDIESGLTFHNCKNYSNLTIGNNCHIGKNCFLDLRDKITIKDNVTISMECKLITHQDVGKSKLSEKYPAIHKPIIIESDVYVGVNSTILMGCRIGENTVIAANSLVLKDVPRRSVAAGVPAKFIKKVK